MYRADTCPVKKTRAQEKKLDVAEMRMLRWMGEVDRIRNKIIKGTTKVQDISKKMQESRLKLYEKSR